MEESDEIKRLRSLVEKGARMRYGSTAYNKGGSITGNGGSIPYAVQQRIDYELDAIAKCNRTGNCNQSGKCNCAEYLLIAHDTVKTAREQFGAVVGPGRNSAAGSILNYCLGITDVDPLRFGLLFERFINPDFQYGSPMDIDIDVDEENRDRVAEWLDEKYPASAAHYDILGFGELAKIKDVAGPGSVPLDDPETLALFREARTTGIYQFDNAGMRYLLLKFLPNSFSDLVLLNAVYRPELMHLIPELTRNKFSRSRNKTYRSIKNAGNFSNSGNSRNNPGCSCGRFSQALGDTGQSDNVQGQLCSNAGKSRSNSVRSGIQYPIPAMAEILDETYGIIVYQEQIMQLAQKLAGFSPTESNILRRALCRKDDEKLKNMKWNFLNGGLERGHEKNALEECWDMMFRGRLAFLKSHTVCYTYLAYKMGYCKRVS